MRCETSFYWCSFTLYVYSVTLQRQRNPNQTICWQDSWFNLLSLQHFTTLEVIIDKRNKFWICKIFIFIKCVCISSRIWSKHFVSCNSLLWYFAKRANYTFSPFWKEFPQKFGFKLRTWTGQHIHNIVHERGPGVALTYWAPSSLSSGHVLSL